LFPIDRDATAKALGFDRPMANSLDAVSDRDFVLETLSAAAIASVHLSRFAEEIVIWTSPLVGLVRLSDKFTSGSSIMPQKRNPDFAEATKAKAALAGATAAALLDLTRGDPSGYNREQQWSKYLVMDLFAELGEAPVVLAGALESLQLDKKRMGDLMRGHHLEAADVADYLAQTRAVPFRAAYRWLGEAVRRSEESGLALAEAVNAVLSAKKGVRPLDAVEKENLASPEYLLWRRRSAGGPSAASVREQCAALRNEFRSLTGALRQRQAGIDAALRRLDQAMRRAIGG